MIGATGRESTLPGGGKDGLKGVLHMCAFALLFATVEGLGAAMSADYSPYQVVWGRYLVHLVLTLAVMLVLTRSIAIRTVRPGVQVCRSAMMLLMPLAFVTAAGEARIELVWALLWLAPLLTMALESRFRAVSFGAPDWIVALACFAGSALVLRPGLDMPLTGALLALLAAVSFAGYMLLTSALRGDSVLTSLFYTATVPFAALSLVMPVVWTPLSARAALLLAAIGVVGWFALLALDRGVRLLHAGHAAVFAFLAVVAGAFIARETGHAATVAGTGIIGVALAVAAIHAVRRREMAFENNGFDQ